MSYFFQFYNLLKPTWFSFDCYKYAWPWKDNYSDCLTVAILVTMPDMYSWHTMTCNNLLWQYFQELLIPLKKIVTIQTCAMLKYFYWHLPSKNEYNWKLSHIFHKYASFKTFAKATTPSSADGIHSVLTYFIVSLLTWFSN